MKSPTPLLQSTDYKTYLSGTLEERSLTNKGQRLKLAQHLKVNPSYVSQVLNGHQDLTPEQAMAASRFLNHTETEARYFLTLVLFARAGTEELKKYYKQELAKQREEHGHVHKRIQVERKLSESEQARYYRLWTYAAIHMIVALPAYQRREQIAEALQLDAKDVNEAVEFLLATGLIKESRGKLVRGEREILLGTDSPFLINHQTHWRLKALQALERQAPDSLHYSTVLTCSQSDLSAIREILMRAIQETWPVIKESKDETMAVVNLDLFRLLRS